MERASIGLSNAQSLCSGGDKLEELWHVEVCQKLRKTARLIAILRGISGKYRALVILVSTRGKTA